MIRKLEYQRVPDLDRRPRFKSAGHWQVVNEQRIQRWQEPWPPLTAAEWRAAFYAEWIPGQWFWWPPTGTGLYWLSETEDIGPDDVPLVDLLAPTRDPWTHSECEAFIRTLNTNSRFRRAILQILKAEGANG